MVKYLIQATVAIGLTYGIMQTWPSMARWWYLQKVRATCPHPPHMFDPNKDQPDPEHMVGFCLECFQTIALCLRA